MTYFVYLKSWFLFLLCSLFSTKNPFTFRGSGGGEGVFCIFYVPREEGFNDFRWNPTGEEGSQKNTILKGRPKMYGPLACEFRMLAVITDKFRMLAVMTGEFRIIAVVTGEFRMLAVITGKFRMLTVITGEFRMLAVITGNSTCHI